MTHCGNFKPGPVTRRDMLRQCASGFGLVALAGLLNEQASGSILKDMRHHRPRAKSVIFLYMDGGPSQVDTFDPKPRLSRENGEPFKMKIERTQFENNGNTLGSPWRFQNYGGCGLPVSDLFPHVGACADELCVIRSMTSEFSEHTNANYFLHTGLGLAGRPSMGSWISYGLGAESNDLPSFVVLDGGLTPPGGLDCFGAGFLPATHQASILKPGDQAIANVRRAVGVSNAQQRRMLERMHELDRRAQESHGRDDAVEAAIKNYELAFRMQVAVPELVDLSHETEATKTMYGLDAAFEPTRTYAAQCLLARRLVERGVRFIELTCPRINGNDRWDQHSNLKGAHESNALAVDQPIAALIKDLKRRGLLDSTLVVWAGEFGRTPFAQGSDGRDHNPFGYSIWLAGGGVRGGQTIGETDEYGYKVVERPIEMYDLHATMLHLLGVDHTRLTHRFGGRDMRLTDVHGHVIHEAIS